MARKSITGHFSNEKPLRHYDRSLMCSADLFIFFLFLPSKSILMNHEVSPESYASVLPRSFDLLSRCLRWLHISGSLYNIYTMLPLLTSWPSFLLSTLYTLILENQRSEFRGTRLRIAQCDFGQAEHARCNNVTPGIESPVCLPMLEWAKEISNFEHGQCCRTA